MGLFSNPDCPHCGRELTIGTDGLEDYYHCVPCLRKARKEKKEKNRLKAKVAELEKRLASLENKDLDS